MRMKQELWSIEDKKRLTLSQDQPGPSKPPEKDNQVARPTKPSAEVPRSDSSTSNSPKMKLGCNRMV
jgi:hypothetical protein